MYENVRSIAGDGTQILQIGRVTDNPSVRLAVPAGVLSCALSRLTFYFSRHYSLLKLFTGFATAALSAWKLTVSNAIKMAVKPASANTHQLILTR